MADHAPRPNTSASPHAQYYFIRQHVQTATPPPDDPDCPLCRQAYDGSDGSPSEDCVRITNLPGCNHLFGENCLYDFLSSGLEISNRCPFCLTQWFVNPGRMERFWFLLRVVFEEGLIEYMRTGHARDVDVQFIGEGMILRFNVERRQGAERVARREAGQEERQIKGNHPGWRFVGRVVVVSGLVIALAFLWFDPELALLKLCAFALLAFVFRIFAAFVRVYVLDS